MAIDLSMVELGSVTQLFVPIVDETVFFSSTAKTHLIVSVRHSLCATSTLTKNRTPLSIGTNG